MKRERAREPDVLLVSDVHGAFEALHRVAATREPLLILGDLVNLVDYRTMEGIIPDIVGRGLVEETIEARARGREDHAEEAWRRGVALLDIDVGARVREVMEAEYRKMSDALEGASAYVIHGNVDSPDLLEEHLPAGCAYVDGKVLEIEGVTVGFAGGGVQRIGSRGEISDDTMRQKLALLGPVDVLCTHIAPALPMLAEDVIGGSSKGSEPVLDYLDEHQPRFHFFGDIHQPRAITYDRGTTRCVNVGYFRATGRPTRHPA